MTESGHPAAEHPSPVTPQTEAGQGHWLSIAENERLSTNGSRMAEYAAAILAIEREAADAMRKEVACTVESFRYSEPLVPGFPHEMWDGGNRLLVALCGHDHDCAAVVCSHEKPTDLPDVSMPFSLPPRPTTEEGRPEPSFYDPGYFDGPSYNAGFDDGKAQAEAALAAPPSEQEEPPDPCVCGAIDHQGNCHFGWHNPDTCPRSAASTPVPALDTVTIPRAEYEALMRYDEGRAAAYAARLSGDEGADHE